MNFLKFFPLSPGSLGVNVIGCGHQKQFDKGWIAPKRYFKDYVLCFIAGSSAWYESDVSNRQFIPAGSCVIRFPGVGSVFQPCNHRKWEEYWLHFHGPVIRVLESEGILLPGKPVFHIRRSPVLLKLFRESIRLALCPQPETAQKRLSGLVLHILNEIVVPGRETATGLTSSTAITSLVRQILKNPSKNWEFKSLAHKMGINYHYLIRQLKNAVAQTPHQFVNLERMKLACQYLATGSTIQETCFRIGMEDPYHFSRLFKKTMGKAPLYFRNIRKG